MSYSTIKYPASFGVLKPEIRRKAIEIANTLIDEGFDPQKAEVIAIANSRELARNFNSTHAHVADCTIHVIPHVNGWAIISPDASKFFAVYESKKDAMIRARSYAKCVKFKLFVHSQEGYIEDCENFIVNRPLNVAADRQPYSRIFAG
jgi:hypothetical protein